MHHRRFSIQTWFMVIFIKFDEVERRRINKIRRTKLPLLVCVTLHWYPSDPTGCLFFNILKKLLEMSFLVISAFLFARDLLIFYFRLSPQHLNLLWCF